jgi:anti-sigma-K factor RskA
MAVRRNQNLYRSQAEWRLGPVSAGLVIVAVIAVLALLYLQQITKTSVFGYQLTALKQERSQAVAAKQELEVEAARLTSIQQIQSSQAVNGLVPTSQVSYAK